MIPLAPILRALAIPAAALVLAAVSNAVAGPGRRLAWTGRVPAPAVSSPLPAPAEPVPAAPLQAAPLQAAPSQAAPSQAAPKAAPSPQAAPVQAAPSKAPVFPAIPGSPVRDITPAQAWEAWQAGVPFLDARRSADYADGHVKGAWSLPVWEDGVQEAIIRFEAQAAPDPKAPLVLYCSGGDCEDSHLLARRLLELGYRNLLMYGGGWPDWAAKGRPAAKGGVR